MGTIPFEELTEKEKAQVKCGEMYPVKLFKQFRLAEYGPDESLILILAYILERTTRENPHCSKCCIEN